MVTKERILLRPLSFYHKLFKYMKHWAGGEYLDPIWRDPGNDTYTRIPACQVAVEFAFSPTKEAYLPTYVVFVDSDVACGIMLMTMQWVLLLLFLLLHIEAAPGTSIVTSPCWQHC